ncbi:hypothetical protein ACS0TY_014386 [Phlomoides rotata]
MEKSFGPLNVCRTLKIDLVINRLYMVFLGVALSALFYYRITTLSHIIKTGESPFLPHFLIFTTELLFTFLWFLHQAFRWKPVVRTVHPERLPQDQEFPGVDVFVFTADPVMEPALGVMNTVLSAMALDYPPDKLAVYLSDDGGSSVTLNAVRETWKFSKWWIPFCRKYELKTRCADAYFSNEERESDDDVFGSSSDFLAEKKEMERRYYEFKERLEKLSANASGSVSRDHAAIIEVMNYANGEEMDLSTREMPCLVYVSREKRPSHPHHFKAGAVNTLIRVSAVISNAPYILILDCDHYCNDPTSARQAMCFYLDPEISPTLAFVQFPQAFHNISVHDIYDCRLNYFNRRWIGADGIGGPGICGCNLFLKREALYGTTIIKKDIDVNYLKRCFGPSNEIVKSIYEVSKPHSFKDMRSIDALKKELELVASVAYDNQSEWGKEVGFDYWSVVEDHSTSLVLFSRGWKSVWIDPPRPCFLGSCPTNLSDMLVQQARWGLGLMQVSLSKSSALVYWLRGKISTLHSMCFAANALDPINVIPLFGISVVPQICLLHGIPLYPKVSDPFFLVFAFIFVASLLKHVQEVLSYGQPIRDALYELRVWMMKSSSCYLFSTLGVVLDKVGLHKANFTLTNKVVDDDQKTLFHKGVYDFRASPLLIAPMCSLYILNVACFMMGVARIIQSQKGDELFAQAVIALFAITVNYHVFDGMVLRKDRGRVSPSVSLISVAVTAIILSFASLILMF